MWRLNQTFWSALFQRNQQIKKEALIKRISKKFKESFQTSLKSVCNNSHRFATKRSSHRRCSVRKGVLKKFAKFRGKHLCQSLFFNKET